MKYVCVFMLLLGITILSVKADVVVSIIHLEADSVVIFKFKARSNVFMPAMFGNEKSMVQLKAWGERYRHLLEEGKCHFSVESFCQDFDSNERNEQVARERSLYVKGYLIRTLSLKESYFMTKNRPVESFYEVQQGGAIVKKEMPANWEKIESRQQQIEIPVFRDTVFVRDTVIKEIVHEVYRDLEPVVESRAVVLQPVPVTRGWIVRTNLLSWLVLTPQAGIEYRLNDRWAVCADVQWTRLNWNSDARTYRIALGGGEARCYLTGCLAGCFTGVFFEGGKFNYKLGETGYQGNLLRGGLTAGYVKSLPHRLLLELSAGVGYMHCSYDTYIRDDGEDILTGSSIRNSWGISRAQVALGWKF